MASGQVCLQEENIVCQKERFRSMMIQLKYWQRTVILVIHSLSIDTYIEDFLTRLSIMSAL